MKKMFGLMVGLMITAGIAAAQSTVSSFAAPKLVEEINTALADPTHTTLAVSGKSTLSGELEVNGAVVDVNMNTNANVITIDQTAVAGTASTPLIAINDARTGTTANEAAEAALVIDAEGTYALYVEDGTVGVESLTASLPVYTDANKVLVSGTTGLSVTNATVGGGVLSGVGVVVTNVASATTIAAATNGTISSFDNPTNISSTTTTVATNGTIDVTLNVTSNAFVYLDGSSNIVTNYFVTAVSVDTKTFTPQTADVLASAALQTVSVEPTFTPQTANAIATLTVESGTPAVSVPTITLATGTFAKQ